jgi:tetratricopeptide (TPR) repeat protein
VAEIGPKRSYSREEVCRLLKLRESVLEDWESHGFVTRLEQYAFRDLIALKTLRQLRRSRYSAERIKLILSVLRERLRHVHDPLTDLKIFTDGRKLTVQVDGQKMEALSGQLLMDFDKEEIRRLLAFPGQRSEETIAEALANRQREARKWFERGVEMEQSGAPPEQIIEAYGKALEFDEDAAGAWVNLGTIHFHLRRWKEAEQHYRTALQKRPDYALAHYNLGNLYDETGSPQQALSCYLRALELDESYADAHYNVALLYQNRGESLKALKHWRAYLKIDPAGYWAGIARRELARLRQESLVGGGRG